LIGSVRFREQRDAALREEKLKTEKLFEAKLAEARAKRTSHRQGQRFETLEAIQEAVQITRETNQPEGRFLELRNEAIASLALTDARLIREWDCPLPEVVRTDFDPDLRHYAISNTMGTLSLRSLDDDREVLRASTSGMCWPLFSPRGRYFAACQTASIQMWDLDQLQMGPILKEAANRIAFRPDEQRVALLYPDGGIAVHELPSRRLLFKRPPSKVVHILAYHPFKDQLALAGNGRVQILDLPSNVLLWDAPENQNNWPYAAWHPEGKMLTTVDRDHAINLWDVARYKPITRLEGNKHAGIDFLFDQPGRLLASRDWSDQFALFDAYTGQFLFRGAFGANSYKFDVQGRLLAIEQAGNRLRLWGVIRSRNYQHMAHYADMGKTNWMDCSVHPSKSLLAVGTDHGFGFTDLSSGRNLGYFQFPHLVHLSFDETTGDLLTSTPKGIQRWPVSHDADSPGLLRIGPPESLPLPGSDYRLSTSSDGSVLASPMNWGAIVLHHDHPESLLRLRHEDVRGVAVSPNGRRVALGSWGLSKFVKVCATDSGEVVKELESGHGCATVVWSPDGRWLASSGENLHLWETGTWQEAVHFPVSSRSMVAFSPDSKLFAYEMGHGAIRLVDTQAWQEIARLENPDQAGSGDMTFTSDGMKILVCTTDTESIQVWDLGSLHGELEPLGLAGNLPRRPEPQPTEQPVLAVNMVWETHKVNGQPPLPGEIVFEGEDLNITEVARSSVYPQPMQPWGIRHWSNDKQLLCCFTKGGHVEATLAWPQKGRYHLAIAFSGGYDYGLVQTSLDGKKIGSPFDAHNEVVTPLPPVDMGIVELGPGPHRLRFTSVGKNDKSKDYFIGIDYLAFTPASN
jgi:WD40 repeat protein